jgi:flagellar motor switch protein FliM
MAAGDVLIRKLKSGGIARSPLPDTELIGDTFARLVEDRLRPLVKTIVGAMVVEARVTKLSEALQQVSVPAMLGVVEVEGASTEGLIGIDTDLAFHLIDLMLGGDPALAPAPTARAFTGIDMALGRMQLEALIAAFVEAVSVAFGRPLTRRIAVREQRQNVAQLRIAPDYVDVLVFSIALDLGEAARTGSFRFLLPLATLDVIRSALQDRMVEAAERPDDLWRTNMRLAAASSPVTVDAVLYRHRLPLAELHALKPGDVLELPANAIDEVQLLIGQPGGRTALVATGRLGAFQGAKVVKLETPLDPRVRGHVSRALA